MFTSLVRSYAEFSMRLRYFRYRIAFSERKESWRPQDVTPPALDKCWGCKDTTFARIKFDSFLSEITYYIIRKFAFNVRD